MAGVVGEAIYKISYDANTGELKSKLAQTNSTIESSGDKSGSKWANAWSVAAGTLVSKGVSKIASTITSNIGNAISRVDTLNNSDKVFTAMGYSVDATSKSMDTLTKYLDGLPTSMTSAISNVQSLSASFGGIEKGTEVFMDMNNAGLAFGATSAMIDNAITQLGQLSMDGPLDAQTWNSLRNSGFGPVFAAMAKEAGITVGELKEQFGARGSKTVGDFLNDLHRLNTEGGGGMESLSELAKKNTSGIGTALENVENRIGKAIAKIIDSIGAENISGAINAFSSSFSGIADIVIGLGKWVVDNWGTIQPILIAVGSFFGGLLAMGIGTKIITFLKTTAGLVSGHPILLAISLIAAGATWIIENWSGIAQFFGETFEGIGNIISGAWNGLVEGAKSAWEGITGIFKGLAEFFGSIFSGAWNAVKAVFSVGGKIFDGIKDGIVNAFKTIVNAIIGGINKVVAIPFNAINGVLNVLRGIDILGIKPFGWVGQIGVPQIPKLATGGIVPDTKGGRMIIAGEGGEDEWVVPESKMASLIDQLNERGAGGGNITVNVYGTFATSTNEQRKVAEVIAQRIQEIQRSRLNEGSVI